MAEDSDLERTEAATPRRIQQAREKGQVAHSRELNTFVILMASGGLLLLFGNYFTEAMSDLLRKGLMFDHSDAMNTAAMSQRLFDLSFEALKVFLPFMLVVAVAAIASSVLVTGWLFSFEALQPSFSRLDPLSGIKRMFSWTSLIELLKAVGKTILIGGVAIWYIWANLDAVLGLIAEPWPAAIGHLASLTGETYMVVAGSIALIVAIDVPFQLWDYAEKLKMTKEEVKQEAKEMEGDPQIKGRIRSKQRELARRRMMEAVPKADVIVTNPTHYAVALQYQEQTMKAPKVVAKGSHLLAQRIIELGQENRVPILRAPPLARALYRHAELEQEIPAELYTAVAEVLAYIYQLRQYEKTGGVAPNMPAEVSVPPGMDPESWRPEQLVPSGSA